MDPISLIILVIVVIGVITMLLYNRLVALRQNRENAFADIDVQLKQRSDLIPNLVETVKGYAAHEQSVLQQVTDARSRAMQSATTGDRIASEQLLSSALANLFAVAENYPDLKANTNFQQLQAELSDIENKLAAARRFFNNATNEYNTATEQFPGNLIAGMFGFKKETFFDLGAEQRQQMDKPPSVKFG